MDTHAADIESVTLNKILELASWNRERSPEELRSYVDTLHSRLPQDVDLGIE